ncbi:hypothetical protein [uncultured Clostridium sp.]|uniref:hypothetical protein n=1 Tax=uncultured Clostridium sp. TaxID=59620 RepID=UPI0028E91B4C|nr:hypothetical protein [uncultured Clostridium sp.]
MYKSEVIIIEAALTNLRMFEQITTPLYQVTRAAEISVLAIDDVSDSLDRGADSSNGLSSKLKDLISNFLGFENIKKGLYTAIEGAARLEREIINMGNTLGNKDIGKAFFLNLNKHANESAYSIEEFNAVTRQFSNSTRNPKKLMDLNKASEKLTLLDPGQGLEGAGSALKEALGGDYTSLQSNFKFNDGDTQMLQSAEGMDDFINKFNILLEKKGATEQALEELNTSALVQFNNIKSSLETAFLQTGSNALEALKPILSTINEWFREGRFQPFFDFISAGFSVIATIGTWAFSLISNSIDVVIDNMNFITDIVYNLAIILLGLSPIILGLAAAWGIYNAIVFITGTLIPAIQALMTGWSFVTLRLAGALALATIKHRLFYLVASLNPIGVVIGLIVGLISAMLAFSAVTNGIRKTFADAFGYIVDIAQWAVNAMINILNGAIKGINNVSSFFANLLGVEAKQIKEIEYRADFSKFKASGQDFIENATIDDIKAKFGLDKLSDLQDPLENYADDSNELLNNLNTDQKDGLALANNNLGQIKDSVDISNEHLELMRDLAEQESIQNFVTLTPTVQVTTGDVKEEADINKIISRIENYMQTELVNSAEGVYA